MTAATEKRILSIAVDFVIGDVVFLRCRSERHAGIVTAIVVSASGGLTYYVTWDSGDEKRHFAIELTTEFLPQFD